MVSKQSTKYRKKVFTSGCSRRRGCGKEKKHPSYITHCSHTLFSLSALVSRVNLCMPEKEGSVGLEAIGGTDVVNTDKTTASK
jgi:hypothetical protein